jgi:hypothetical protein
MQTLPSLIKVGMQHSTLLMSSLIKQENICVTALRLSYVIHEPLMYPPPDLQQDSLLQSSGVPGKNSHRKVNITSGFA